MKTYPVIKHHDMKTSGGMEVQLQAFLTSALDEFHAPTALHPGKKPPEPIGYEA